MCIKIRLHMELFGGEKKCPLLFNWNFSRGLILGRLTSIVSFPLDAVSSSNVCPPTFSTISPKIRQNLFDLVLGECAFSRMESTVVSGLLMNY